MATAVTGPRSCGLTVNLFSGDRMPFPATTEVLLTVIDGNQKQVHRETHKASSITFEGLPFYDNFGDNYSVVASAKGYSQAGFSPVKLSPRVMATADIMLVRKNGGYNFSQAKWDQLSASRSEFIRVLSAGGSAKSARDRYTDLIEERPAVLACMFNLFTAMEQIHLPDRTPLHYLSQMIWDKAAQDRFFAWADKKLVEQVVRCAEAKVFAPEPAASLFHPGATRSYKQTQFGEANVQLSFHENDTNTIDGVDCVIVEADIDYYRDPLSHTLLEVAINKLTHGLTDPRQVYVLRWMAGRQSGVPNFEPPYSLE
jgi:hypothetical protein